MYRICVFVYYTGQCGRKGILRSLSPLPAFLSRQEATLAVPVWPVTSRSYRPKCAVELYLEITSVATSPVGVSPPLETVIPFCPWLIPIPLNFHSMNWIPVPVTVAWSWTSVCEGAAYTMSLFGCLTALGTAKNIFQKINNFLHVFAVRTINVGIDYALHLPWYCTHELGSAHTCKCVN